jgi:hypothetical protein
MLRILLEKTGGMRTSGLSASPAVQSSLCQGDDGAYYLWLINHSDRAEKASMQTYIMNGVREVLWGDGAGVSFENGTLKATIPGKDAIVLALS